MTDVVPHFTDEEVAGWEAEWIKGALASRDEIASAWRDWGGVFAHVHPEPTYVSAADWALYAGIPNPKDLCPRVIRFDLIGGGQLKVLETFETFGTGSE